MESQESTASQESTEHPAPSRKAAQRSEQRAARRRAYGGPEGAERRAREARALVDAAAPLIEGLLAHGTEPTLTAFHPTPTEPDVLVLLAAIREQIPGVRVLFPASGGGPDLDWALWDGSSAFADSPGAGFGAEPQGPRCGADGIGAADLILAPALAVDRSGTRLGHGGGYYDRALPRRRPGTPVIAVVHPGDVLAPGALVRAEHDVPVDGILSAEGLLRL